MTIQEKAIEQLERISEHLSAIGEKEDYTDIAIKALEQQPCEDTEVIKVSKGAVKARQGRFVVYDVDWLKKNFYTTEEKIYGQPKQPCIEDYPTCTECEHYDRDKHYCPRFCQVIKDTLAEAQPTDAVSRTLVHEAITASIAETENPYEMWQRIEALPPVTPQRPKGKWKGYTHYAYHGTDDMGEPIWREVIVYHCSECKRRTVIKENYCPNCGAEMSGGEEDAE